MPWTVPPNLTATLVALLVFAPPEVEPPVRQEPARPTRKADDDRAEALRLYAKGALLEKKNRLLEAVKAYEAAVQLDPTAAAPRRALVPLYLALDRLDDARACCRKVLELDPDDAETALNYSRQLRVANKAAEAVAVLTKAVASSKLKDNPDLRVQVDFDLGVLHEAAGEWGKAEAAFRQVTEVLDHPAALLEQGPYSREEVDTKAAEVHERIGRMCLKAGRPEDAIKAFLTARKRDPVRTARLAYNLAEVYLQKGDAAEALARLEEYLQSQPMGTDGYELKIEVLKRLNRGADVVSELKSAAERDRHNKALQILLAREYGKAKQIEQAEQIYAGLLKESPTAEIYRGLFDLYKTDARSSGEKVLTRLNEAVKKAAGKEDSDDPRDTDPIAAAHARAMLQVLRDDKKLVEAMLPAVRDRLQRGDRSLAHQTRVVLGGLAARTNQLDVAEALYRSCLNNGAGREHEVYAGLLTVLQLARKHAEVIEICNKGLEKAQATNRILFHLDLAEARMALGQTKEALAAADAAVNDSGEKDRLFCRRVRVEMLSQAGKHDAAIAECQALLKEYNQPGEVRDVRYALSGAYTHAKDFAKAEEQLKRILEADPNDAAANNDLGYVWADRNKELDEAERMIRKAIELDRGQRSRGSSVGLDADRDKAAYVDSLGWVLFRRGKLKEALKELEKAVTLQGGTEDPVLWDHLGDVRYRLEDKEGAVMAWKQALDQYNAGRRRKSEERYEEIKQKLRLVEP